MRVHSATTRVSRKRREIPHRHGAGEDFGAQRRQLRVEVFPNHDRIGAVPLAARGAEESLA